MSQVIANPTMKVMNSTTSNKRKTKRNQTVKMPLFYRFGMVLFAFSLVLWLGCSLFLRSYNINLSMEQQEIQSKISSLQVENDAMKVEIQALNSRERVTNIAEDAGLATNQNNIVTVDGQ